MALPVIFQDGRVGVQNFFQNLAIPFKVEITSDNTKSDMVL